MASFMDFVYFQTPCIVVLKNIFLCEGVSNFFLFLSTFCFWPLCDLLFLCSFTPTNYLNSYLNENKESANFFLLLEWLDRFAKIESLDLSILCLIIGFFFK